MMTATEQATVRRTLDEIAARWTARAMLGGFGGYDRGAAFTIAVVDAVHAIDRTWESLDAADETWLTNTVTDLLDGFP